ncbi:hypothetical protein QL285_081496 [Trifolium repens]|nr:hypothetical protein QL285_081496 [Trifolium repens]
MCDCAIKVPPSCRNSFIFGSLKVLKLCGIIFTIDKSEGIIFSVLKKFETKNCSWLSAHDVNVEIHAPLLESVYIEQDHKSVTREARRCTIKFSAPCMKEFTYSGYGISQAITLSDPSSARNASANIILHRLIYGKSTVPGTESYVCMLLKQFNQAKCIKFHGSEVLTQPNVAVLPKFAMLSHLELCAVSGKVLLGLLRKTPVLKTLFLKEISKFDQELMNSAVVPDCLASTLKVVKFGNVYGDEHEVFLAKFFMENGMVLERISFSLVRRFSLVNRRWQGEELIEEFKEKLYSFKKGVSFAMLEFRY